MRSGQDTRRSTLWVLAALALVAALLALVPATAGADEVEWMYQPEALVEIDLGGLSAAELDELEAEPGEEVHGTFELKVDGRTKAAFEDVGIRLKGGTGSFEPVKTGKAAFKVRFDKFVDDQLFFGLQRLTLNNLVQDPSMVHETLTYEIFRALGLPASRTGYALVRVNGEFFGVYLNIETLDKVFLEAHFPSTQHLYEADEPGVDVRTGEAGTFEVDRGDEEDLSDLEALIAAANDVVDDWSEGMAATADLTRMTRVWAVERYVSHWDGYAGVQAPFRPNNYYLHSLSSGVFEMLPWGADQTWEIDMEFDEAAGGLLFNNCLADETCEALYEQGLEEVRAAVPGLELDRRAFCVAEKLAPWQQMETEPRRGYDAEEIAEGVENTRALIADRAAELDDYLGTETPEVPVDEGPCTKGQEPQQPEEPQQPQPQPRVDPPPTTATIGPSKVAGAFVATQLQITGPASATQRVTARLDGRRVTVCTDRSSSAAAARLTVRCKLSKAALTALHSGPLKLKVRVAFYPEVGTARTVTRRPTAPARN
jgi:CotH kinase protein